MELISRIYQAEAVLNAAKHELERVITEVQDECPHDVLVLEAWPDFGRPYRVCTKCGYAEEGWGSGYRRLYRDNRVMKVDDEESRKYVKKLHRQKRDCE